MAIAFDNSLDPGASSTSFNYTATGSNIFMVVEIATGTIFDASQTVTFNGVSLIQDASHTVTGNGFGYSYHLVGASSGTKNITVTQGSGYAFGINVATWSGVGSVNGSTANFGALSSGNYSMNITPGVANCWVVMASSNGNSGPTAVTNYTSRINQNAQALGIGDSNGTVTSGVSFTETVFSGENNVNTYQGVIYAIAPVGAAVVALPFRSLLGVGI